MNKHTDQEKIDFFDANWEYLEKIIDIVNSEKLDYVPAGMNVFRWLVQYLEGK